MAFDEKAVCDWMNLVLSVVSRGIVEGSILDQLPSDEVRGERLV